MANSGWLNTMQIFQKNTRAYQAKPWCILFLFKKTHWVKRLAILQNRKVQVRTGAFTG